MLNCRNAEQTLKSADICSELVDLFIWVHFSDPWTVPATISFVKKQNHVLRHFVRNNETWRWLAKFQANFRWKCWTCLLLTVGILSQSVDGFLFEFRVLFAHYGRHWWRLAVAGGDRKTKDERRVFEMDRIAPRTQTKKWHTVDVLLTNKYAKQMLRQCLFTTPITSVGPKSTFLRQNSAPTKNGRSSWSDVRPTNRLLGR